MQVANPRNTESGPIDNADALEVAAVREVLSHPSALPYGAAYENAANRIKEREGWVSPGLALRAIEETGQFPVNFSDDDNPTDDES